MEESQGEKQREAGNLLVIVGVTVRVQGFVLREQVFLATF
jgi:hypothetical protein